MKRLSQWTAASMVALALGLAGQAQADFLDLDSLTTGTAGSFSGTVDGITVAGAITTQVSSFEFRPTGPIFGDSTTDNTSPQYSYAGIFTPTIALTDKIGYGKSDLNMAQVARVTITFGAPVINPVIHVSNLDSGYYDFAPTSGLGALVLLSGNGGGGDGLGITGGTRLVDLDPTTIVGVAPTSPPPTTGARSAYGSVQLTGTFTSLVFDFGSNPAAISGDGGNFTFSADAAAVPEPSSVVLMGAGVVGVLGYGWRRRKAAKMA
jgi:hypothetical protein